VVDDKSLLIIFLISISILTGLSQVANAENSANLDHCANGPLNNEQQQNSCNESDSWVNGNLNENKAHWREGESTVYRLYLTGLENNISTNPEFPPGSGFHNVIIGYDITHSDKHGIDYLTSFNRTETMANPCISQSQGKDSMICDLDFSDKHAIPIPVLNTIDYDDDGNPDGPFQPKTSFTNLVAAESEKSTLIWAFVPSGESIDILDIEYVAPFGDFSDSNSQQAISIDFVTQSENAVLSWGGHIASRSDWGFETSQSGFEANSAGEINGSPYHMRLLELDGSGGNQDLPLDALAVIPPINTPPTAEDDTYIAFEETILTVPTLFGVLTNDTDDGSKFPLTALLDTDVSDGTLVLFSDGGFEYASDPGFTGTDSFTYNAFDGEFNSTATVTTSQSQRWQMYLWQNQEMILLTQSM
jgi:hypothetical protein